MFLPERVMAIFCLFVPSVFLSLPYRATVMVYIVAAFSPVILLLGNEFVESKDLHCSDVSVVIFQHNLNFVLRTPLLSSLDQDISSSV